MSSRTSAPEHVETPQRPGQPGSDDRRPGPSPASAHPTGPAPPFESAEERSKTPAQTDAKGQYAKAQAKPNKDGLSSANPVVLSGDGDATPGNGHGRDRDGKA
jgi:hypothetical protein